jgi:hypothetical protein
MSTAYQYIIGTDYILDTPEGTEIRRVDRLDGVWGDAYAQAVNVLTDANVPTLGTAHPAKGDAYLEQRIVRALEPGRFDVELIYRTRDTLWSAGGQFELAVQRTGYKSQYTPEGDEIYTQSGTETQRHVVEREIPIAVWKWRRIKTSLSTAMLDMAAVGCVNLSEFKGHAAGSLLCAHGEVARLYEGAWMQVFEFQANPVGWDVTVTHEDFDGRPVEDPTIDEQRTYRVFNEYDFNTLALDVQ